MEKPKIDHPHNLHSLADVATYWRECLNIKGIDDQIIASRLVGVVSNEHDQEWSSNPVYGLIFELAASLETPLAGDAHVRQIKWDCIRALIPVLEQYSR